MFSDIVGFSFYHLIFLVIFLFLCFLFEFLFLRMTKFLKFISPSTAFEAIHSIFTLLIVVINILTCVYLNLELVLISHLLLNNSKILKYFNFNHPFLSLTKLLLSTILVLPYHNSGYEFPGDFCPPPSTAQTKINKICQFLSVSRFLNFHVHSSRNSYEGQWGGAFSSNSSLQSLNLSPILWPLKLNFQEFWVRQMPSGQFTTWIFSCYLLFASWEFPFPPERRIQLFSLKCLFQQILLSSVSCSLLYVRRCKSLPNSKRQAPFSLCQSQVSPDKRLNLWLSLSSLLDCKEIQPVNPKRNQPWIFIGRTDVEAETPILWPPDVKNWLTGKTEGRRRREQQRMR